MFLRASVERSGLPALLLALATTGCGSDERGDATDGPWQKVFEGLPQALLSVWGTSSTDVWAVGADVGDGTGPLILHFDGNGWTRPGTSSAGDLWWVFGFAAGPVFAGGAGGRVLRRGEGAFEAQTTPGTSTVYGIWGAAPDDVWAVGGDGAANAFVWRFDGSVWRDVTLPDGVRDATSLFKVWGRAHDDVWLVGTRGKVLHYDGQTLAEEPSGTERDLFTVHGNAERMVAVGGSGDGLILENDGSGWRDAALADRPVLQLTGVYLGAERGFAVGDYGSVLVREGGSWTPLALGVEIVQSFHAVWVDPDGGVWAVGGEVSTLPLTDGVMAHHGKAVLGGSYEEI